MVATVCRSLTPVGTATVSPGRIAAFRVLPRIVRAIHRAPLSKTYLNFHLLVERKNAKGGHLRFDSQVTSSGMVVRRCPTLPHRGRCSTIGAEGLSFRVRYGSGRFPFAMAAVTLWNYQHIPHTPLAKGRVWAGCCSRTTQWTRSIFVVSPRPISTGQLKHLTVLPLPAYQPGGLAGGLTPLKGGSPHLGTGFPLRCFQRLSLPNVANQPCSWWNNWHTRGPSVPVLSY